jgi:hypothetical protein
MNYRKRWSDSAPTKRICEVHGLGYHRTNLLLSVIINMAQRLQLSTQEVRKRITPIAPDIIQADETDDTLFTALWLDDLSDLDYIFMYHSEDIEIVQGIYDLEDEPAWLAIDFAIVDVDFEGGDHPDVRPFLH